MEEVELTYLYLGQRRTEELQTVDIADGKTHAPVSFLIKQTLFRTGLHIQQLQTIVPQQACTPELSEVLRHDTSQGGS